MKAKDLHFPESTRLLSRHRNLRHSGESVTYKVNCFSYHVYECHGEVILDHSPVISFKPGDSVLLSPHQTRTFNFKTSGYQNVVHFHSNSNLGNTSAQIYPTQSFDIQLMASLQKHWNLQPTRSLNLFKEILYRIMAFTFSTPSTTKDTLVCRAVSLIEHQGLSDISVQDIAKQLNVSHNHLTRSFQKEKGISVIKHIQNMRLEKMKELLVETDLALKSIALEVGIKNLQQLNKFIHNSTGQTPRQWARQVRES
jgi:AraC-like DNA-binding protein